MSLMLLESKALSSGTSFNLGSAAGITGLPSLSLHWVQQGPAGVSLAMEPGCHYRRRRSPTQFPAPGTRTQAVAVVCLSRWKPTASLLSWVETSRRRKARRAAQASS